MTLPLNQYHNSSSSPTSLSPPTSPLTSSHPPSTLTSHFVQALHDYLPSSVNNTDDSVSCLFFKKGTIIEVFNRDDSGWWDGQCGDVRGWFPSNYVGRIGELKRSSADFEDDYSNEELELWHQRMNHHVNNTSTVSLDEYSTKVSTIQTRVEMARALLKEDRRKSSSIIIKSSTQSSSQFHSLVQDVSKRVAELVDACNQPTSSNVQLIVFQVVSAVRSILTEANILNKESALLKMYPELARQRKIVLSALSRLALKGKELQQVQSETEEIVDEHDQPLYFADQLLNEMDMFEKLLMVIPRQSSVSECTVDTTRPSSMFHFDTPRSSVSSLGHSSVISTNSFSTSLRQIATDSRHLNQSNASLIAKAVPISDKEHILHNILDHQTSIDELMASLVMTLERYLVDRQRATEMLETTRKAVEAVRTFLAIVEHVCSNLGDLDYNRRISMIPEDPCLVTLVITKESVYSAITNLVTSVRAITGPQQQQQQQQEEYESVVKEDFDHLCLCCEDVVKTTNECASCVRACLQAEQAEQEEHKKIMYTMQETMKSEDATTAASDSIQHSNSNNDLSILGRKISSLHAIQHYHEDQSEETDSCEKSIDEGHSEQDIEGLAIETAPRISTNSENNAPKNMSNGQDIRTQSLNSSRNLPLPSLSISTSSSSTNTTTNGSDSVNLASAVDTIIPETVPQGRNKLRPRAASVNNSHFLPLPPLPPKSSIVVKPSVSAAAFPLPPAVNTTQQPQQDLLVKGAQKDQILKSRRPRGLSVSSLRPSINKSKSERITTTTTSRLSTSISAESLPEPLRIQKLPSWMSISSNATEKNERNSANSIDITPSSQLHIAKIEPEYDFLKQYNLVEDEMIYNADGEVTGATIEALVRKLTLHEKSPDLIFTRAFFYNFRLFTNPADFIRLLKDRFTLKPPTEPAPLPDDQLAYWTNRVLIPIRLRVYNVIKTWLETYFSFEQDASVEQALVDFASNEMSGAMPGPAKRMTELITRTFASKGLSCAGRKHSYNETKITMQKSYSTSLQSSTVNNSSGNIFSNLALFDDHNHIDNTDKYPQSIIGKSLRNTLKKALNQNNLVIVHVNDFDPTELARQLTIMENSLFCRIRPNEMIGQEFKKKVGTSQAIHVKAMIQRSTQITSWVSDTILNESDSKKRAQVLKYWIKVGDACLQLNNYNTLMAIRSALDSTSIVRLRKTWEYISPKYRSMWEPIYRATDSQRNFAEYRQRLKTTIAPCLPFLGVYLTDMTFIDDGNADHRMSPGGKQLINFDKYVKVTRVLNEIDQFQISYKLFEMEDIQNFLKKTLETVEQDDQVFYAKSLKLEPKEEESIDKLITQFK